MDYIHFTLDKLQSFADITLGLVLILLNEHRTNKLIHSVVRRQLLELLQTKSTVQFE